MPKQEEKETHFKFSLQIISKSIRITALFPVLQLTFLLIDLSGAKFFFALHPA